MSIVIRSAILTEAPQSGSLSSAVVYTLGLDLNSLGFDVANLQVRKGRDETGQFPRNVGSFAFERVPPRM